MNHRPVTITTFNTHIVLDCDSGRYEAVTRAYNAISVEFAWAHMNDVWEGDDPIDTERRKAFFRSLPRSVADVAIRVMSADCGGALDSGIDNDAEMDSIRVKRAKRNA